MSAEQDTAMYDQPDDAGDQRTAADKEFDAEANREAEFWRTHTRDDAWPDDDGAKRYEEIMKLAKHIAEGRSIGASYYDIAGSILQNHELVQSGEQAAPTVRDYFPNITEEQLLSPGFRAMAAAWHEGRPDGTAHRDDNDQSQCGCPTCEHYELVNARARLVEQAATIEALKDKCEGVEYGLIMYAQNSRLNNERWRQYSVLLTDAIAQGFVLPEDVDAIANSGLSGMAIAWQEGRDAEMTSTPTRWTLPLNPYLPREDL